MKIDLQWAFTWADMPAGPCVLCEAEFEPRAVLIRCDPHGAEACEGCLRALSGRKDAFPGAPWPTWEEYEALVAAHPEPMFSSAEQVAASEEETADPETGRWPAYDASLLWMAADQVLSAPVFGVATTPAEHLGQDWREVPRAEMFDRVIVAVDGAKAGAEGVGDRAFARYVDEALFPFLEAEQERAEEEGDS